MKIRTIYFAGGCFWGVQAYFRRIEGVLDTLVGYANGLTQNPSYEDVCHRNTGHAETVRVRYDADVISLTQLLHYFFRIINPTILNRQGNDVGVQYRTGIYYVDEMEQSLIQEFLHEEQHRWEKSIVTEVLPLVHFFAAEVEHQYYLSKNPEGYCHIDVCAADKKLPENTFQSPYRRPSEQELAALDEHTYYITQACGTDLPFSHPYTQQHERGIYVDVVSGEPLFASDDQFDSLCGWPAFSRPIADFVLSESMDFSHGMERVEVRSRYARSHLGHLFADGWPHLGGLRYCINGSSLRFIAFDEMQENGYESWQIWLNYRKENIK